MTAKQMAKDQRQADKSHHVNRVQWLETASPVWSCGTPVGVTEKAILLGQSKDYLRNPAGAVNHCHCEPRCA
jgi:hypothetical protein